MMRHFAALILGLWSCQKSSLRPQDSQVAVAPKIQCCPSLAESLVQRSIVRRETIRSRSVNIAAQCSKNINPEECALELVAKATPRPSDATPFKKAQFIAQEAATWSESLCDADKSYCQTGTIGNDDELTRQLMARLFGNPSLSERIVAAIGVQVKLKLPVFTAERVATALSVPDQLGPRSDKPSQEQVKDARRRYANLPPFGYKSMSLEYLGSRVSDGFRVRSLGINNRTGQRVGAPDCGYRSVFAVTGDPLEAFWGADASTPANSGVDANRTIEWLRMVLARSQDFSRSMIVPLNSWSMDSFTPGNFTEALLKNGGVGTYLGLKGTRGKMGLNHAVVIIVSLDSERRYRIFTQDYQSMQQYEGLPYSPKERQVGTTAPEKTFPDAAERGLDWKTHLAQVNLYLPKNMQFTAVKLSHDVLPLDPGASEIHFKAP